MDDKPTNEEPKKDFNKLDLSQLESFSFGTQWTQDQPEKGGSSRGRDERPRRDGPRDPRKDRRSFKRPAGAPAEGGDDGQGRGGPRGERGDRRGRERPDRGGERREGPGGPGGGGRGPGGPRGDRRRGGPGGGAGQAPAGPYISPYFNVTFYPEDVSFAALSKTIRASCRTFELFDIAKTVIGKHDRFVVVVERKPAADAAEKRPFYVSLPDGLPFETEEAAVNHVMQHHVDKFFRTEEVEVDPPKGSFQVINKCGVTGELLGPPNYHLYNQAVQQHHASRLSRMPFETFRNRIESVRDEETVNAWLESMKKVTRYTWLHSGNAPAASAPLVTEAAPDVDPAAPETEAAAADEAAAETTAPAAPAVPSFDSLTEAKVYLLSHARDKAVRTYEHGRFHGHALDTMPDGEIKRAVLGALERQQRFPLDTANALRGRLRREGFTIFKKGAKGVSYVCAVKRKFRVPGQTFADSIDELINFIETHPMVKVSELPENFLGLTPQPVSPAPAEETPAPAAPPPEEAPAAEQPAPGETAAAAEDTASAPVPAPKPAPAPAPASGTVSPFAPADQPKVKRMQLDLRWLVTEGYVTEFIDGSLFAAAPLPEPKPKAAKPEKAADEEESTDDAENADSVDSADESDEDQTSAEDVAANAIDDSAPTVEEIDAPAPTSEPEAMVESETASEPEATPAPEAVSEPETETEPEVAAATEADPEEKKAAE